MQMISLLKNLKYIIFHILTISLLGTIVFDTFTDTVFVAKNWYGLTSIGILWIVAIFRTKYLQELVFIVLVLGSFNILQFTATNYFGRFGIAIGTLDLDLDVTIQFFSLAMLVINLILNWNVAMRLIQNSFARTEEQDNLEEEYNRYKRKYELLSDYELKEIINNSKSYQEEAVRAAIAILKKKNSL